MTRTQENRIFDEKLLEVYEDCYNVNQLAEKLGVENAKVLRRLHKLELPNPNSISKSARIENVKRVRKRLALADDFYVVGEWQKLVKQYMKENYISRDWLANQLQCTCTVLDRWLATTSTDWHTWRILQWCNVLNIPYILALAAIIRDYKKIYNVEEGT